MYGRFYQKKTLILRKILSVFLAVTFTASLVLLPAGSASAQYISNLPRPGEMVMQSPAFEPPVLKGMTLHPENPLRFDFIVDRGQDMLSGEALKTESTRLLKYFLAAMTIPDNDAWVNLSPYEGDRIIPDMLGTTDLGKQMLEQDYLLKQLSASLTNPQVELGKKFWDTVYKKAYDKFGTTAIPINTFNKVWITPDKAVILEQDGYVFIGESHLKVMLDEDYLALKENMKNEKNGLSQMTPKKAEDVSAVSADVVRQVIVPELEKEINTGKNFAPVRQMYHSVILATWFKQNLKKSLLGEIYVDKSKIKGVDISEKDLKQKIYDQYLAAFRKGVYNLIKEDYDLASKETLPRKYFSGGVVWASAATVITKDIPPFQRTQIQRAMDTLFKGGRFAQEGVLLTEDGSGEDGAIMAGLSAGGLGAGAQIVVPKYDADLSSMAIGEKVTVNELLERYSEITEREYAVIVAGFYGFERETPGSDVLVKRTSSSAYFDHPAVREAAEILANGIMAYHGENLRTATSAYFAHLNSLSALLQESYKNAGEILVAIKTAIQKVPLIQQALLDSFTSLQKHPEFSRADSMQTAFAYQFVGTRTVLLLSNSGVAAAGSAVKTPIEALSVNLNPQTLIIEGEPLAAIEQVLNENRGQILPEGNRGDFNLDQFLITYTKSEDIQVKKVDRERMVVSLALALQGTGYRIVSEDIANDVIKNRLQKIAGKPGNVRLFKADVKRPILLENNRRLVALAMTGGDIVSNLAGNYSNSYDAMSNLVDTIIKSIMRRTGKSREEAQAQVYKELDMNSYQEVVSKLEAIGRKIQEGRIAPQAINPVVTDDGTGTVRKYVIDRNAFKDEHGNLRNPRMGYWPLKGDPWQIGHLWILLESINKFDVDIYIVGVDESDPTRKQGLTSLVVREEIAKAIIDYYLKGLVVYSPIAKDLDHNYTADGETMYPEIMKLNSHFVDQEGEPVKVDGYYGAGSDHAFMKVLRKVSVRDMLTKTYGEEAFFRLRAAQLIMLNGIPNPESFKPYDIEGNAGDIEKVRAALSDSDKPKAVEIYNALFALDTISKIYENMIAQGLGDENVTIIFSQRVGATIPVEQLTRFEKAINLKLRQAGYKGSVSLKVIDQKPDGSSTKVRKDGEYHLLPVAQFDLARAMGLDYWGHVFTSKDRKQQEDIAKRLFDQHIAPLLEHPVELDKTTEELIRSTLASLTGNGLNYIDSLLARPLSGIFEKLGKKVEITDNEKELLQLRRSIRRLFFNRAQEIVVNGRAVPLTDQQREALVEESAAASPVNVLLVEDAPVVAMITQAQLEGKGYKVDVASDLETAQRLYAEGSFGTIITDISLTQDPLDKTGVDFIRWLGEQGNSVPVIVATSEEENRKAVKALQETDQALFGFVKVIGDKFLIPGSTILAEANNAGLLKGEASSASQVVSQPITLVPGAIRTLKKEEYKIGEKIDAGQFRILMKETADGRVFDRVLKRVNGGEYILDKEIPAPGEVVATPLITFKIAADGTLTIISGSVNSLEIEGITVTSASSSTALEGKNVVVVQNDLIARYLKSKGANVSTFSSSEADKAMAQIRSTNPDLIISTNAEFLDRLSYTGRASQLLIVSKDTGIKDNTLSARLRNLGVSIRETEGNTASWISQNVFQQEILYNETGNTPVNLRLENMSRIKKDAEFVVKALGREYKLTISSAHNMRVTDNDTGEVESRETFDLSFELPPGELAEESGPVLLTFEKIDGKYQLVPKQNKEALKLFASLPFKIDFNVQIGQGITNRVTLTPTPGGAIVDYMPEELKSSISQANPGSSTDTAVSRASSDVGGIDFDPTLLKLQIKRNGKGVPLPVEQQNVEQINIEGLFPVILFDRPATIQNFPFLISSGNKENKDKAPELSMR